MATVRGLDNENNPYAGLYEEWDYWAFCKAHEPQGDEARQASAMEFPADWMRVFVRVDKEGYPIPLCFTGKVDSCGAFEALGPVSAQLRERLCEAMLSIDPPVDEPAYPDWLADNPPCMVRAMPEGEFVMLGELGAGRSCYTNTHSFPEAACDRRFYRYSSDGTLLAETAPGEPWRSLYWPGYAEYRRSVEQTAGQRMMYGNLFYFVLYDDPAMEGLTLGMDGNPIDTDREMELWKLGFVVHCGFELLKIHELQQTREPEQLSGMAQAITP